PAPGRFIDDELLAERKREFLRNHSAHRVHTAAWWVRHDQCDGTRRICLRVRRERPCSRRAPEQRDELATFHVGHGGLLPRLMPTPDSRRPWRCDRFAAHLAYHGGDARSLGRPELF